MERISSGLTFVNKWLFPLAWFGGLAFFIFDDIRNVVTQGDPFVLLFPVVMALFGFLVMRKLVWDLADTVDDGGTYLVVRRNGTEVRIDLKNIMNVSATTFVNPARVTLRLVQACELGSEVSFTPRSSLSFNPFGKNAVAENLIERVYHARTANAL